MASRKPINFRKISDGSTLRDYVQHFTGLPRELVGTPMDQERYLNALATKSLEVVSVLPRRHRRVSH